MRSRGQGARRTGVAALVSACIAMVIAGCGFLGADEVPPVTPTPEPTPTPSPEPTPPPTPTPQWPPVGEARILTDDLNVRVGPGRGYAVLGRLATGDQVPVAGRAPGGPWMALPGIGWVFFDASWVELPTSFEELPVIDDPATAWELQGPVHAQDASSDWPVVDEVATAITDGSRSRLLALAVGEEPEAIARVAAGPCPESLLPGTELEEHLDRLLASEVAAEAGALRLYAVVRGPIPEGRDADFVAIFAFEGGEGRQLWISPQGEITRFNLGCDGEPTMPGELLRLSDTEPFFWFRPPLPEPLRPVP